jgi:transposase InsO family protein
MTIFAGIDHYITECVGIHGVKKSHPFRSTGADPQRANEYSGGFKAGVAPDQRLRHGHGSVYMSDDFQSEFQFLGVEPSPAFVRQPESNGCIERFFRTLKEQLRRFRDLAELRAAMLEFRHRHNQHWIVERLNYRRPVQARHDFSVELKVAA